jgi:hypothetical protein
MLFSSCPAFLLSYKFSDGGLSTKKADSQGVCFRVSLHGNRRKAGASVSLYDGQTVEFMAAKITKAKIIALGKGKAICSFPFQRRKSHLSTRL